MGAIHNELRRTPLSYALTRAVGDSQGAGGLERYGETLTPVLDLFSQPEWAYLRKEWLCTLIMTQTAVAAEYSIGGLANPAGSGLIVVVDAASFYSSGANLSGSLNRVTEAAALATLVAYGRGTSRDTRSPTLPGMAYGVYGTDAGTVGAQMESALSVAGSQIGKFASALPFILSPGQALLAQVGTVNITAQFMFRYRERKAFPGELE